MFFSSCQKEAAQFVNDSLRPPTVDAGSSKEITLPTNFDTLSGTATSYNGPIVGYLWSLISGPSVPVIESPSSKTTRVSQLNNVGIYKFQFAAIDSAGLTGVDTVSITVKQNPIQTLFIRPANSLYEGNVLGNSFVPGRSFTAVNFVIGTWTFGGVPDSWRSFIKFDFSQIPLNAQILSATLKMYANPNPEVRPNDGPHFGTNNAMYIERVTSAWQGSTLHWGVQPTVNTTNRVSIPHTNIRNENLITDVTQLVRDIQASTNYGFRLILQQENFYNVREYCTSYFPTESQRPSIEITYR
jgi:hypothetical protein